MSLVAVVPAGGFCSSMVPSGWFDGSSPVFVRMYPLFFASCCAVFNVCPVMFGMVFVPGVLTVRFTLSPGLSCVPLVGFWFVIVPGISLSFVW